MYRYSQNYAGFETLSPGTYFEARKERLIPHYVSLGRCTLMLHVENEQTCPADYLRTEVNLFNIQQDDKDLSNLGSSLIARGSFIDPELFYMDRILLKIYNTGIVRPNSEVVAFSEERATMVEGYILGR